MYYLLGSGKPQWTTFRHNGPMFPPKYEPHNIPVLVNNVKIVLPPESEEYATLYARYINTEYTTNPIFNKNFLCLFLWFRISRNSSHDFKIEKRFTNFFFKYTLYI